MACTLNTWLQSGRGEEGWCRLLRGLGGAHVLTELDNVFCGQALEADAVDEGEEGKVVHGLSAEEGGKGVESRESAVAVRQP